MNEGAVQINTQGLDKILRALKNPPNARLGILGNKGAIRYEGEVKVNSKGAANFKPQKIGKYVKAVSPTTNAEVGAAHEFGSPARGLPMRSFLRVPLMLELDTYLERAGAFNEDVLRKTVATGSLESFMKKLAITALAVVLDGFDSGGFGTWLPLKPETLARKQNRQILVETQQLRDSITWEVT